MNTIDDKDCANLAVYSYYHKPFLTNRKSTWHKPITTIPYTSIDHLATASVKLNERHMDDIIDISQSLNVVLPRLPSYNRIQLANHLEGQAIFFFLKFISTRNFCSPFLGLTTYRRLLLPLELQEAVINLEISQPNFDFCTSEEMGQRQLTLLDKFDCLLATQTPVLGGSSQGEVLSIEEQYLKYQDPDYWWLFRQGLEDLYPNYRHIADDYFCNCNEASFESPVICRSDLFLKMGREFINLIMYVWSYSKTPIPLHATNTEPKPWRYLGFLGERFFPFFFLANKCRVKYIPLVRFI
jgi:hypothetical protein